MGRPTKKQLRYKNVGRKPNEMTETILTKLRECFSNSFTDQEACLFVGISTRQLYDYCKGNEQFREEKELLKSTPSIQAKMNIIRNIRNGNVKESLWWLERKSKGEFNTKVFNEEYEEDKKQLVVEIVNYSKLDENEPITPEAQVLIAKRILEKYQEKIDILARE